MCFYIHKGLRWYLKINLHTFGLGMWANQIQKFSRSLLRRQVLVSATFMLFENAARCLVNDGGRRDTGISTRMAGQVGG